LSIRHARETKPARSTKPTTDARERALTATRGALDHKALEPALLDVRNATSYTDYILLVSGRSDRQVQAVADGVVEAMLAEGVKPLGVEGDSQGHWVLLDFGDVVVHVFYHPLREFYDLEGLWLDATRVPLEVPPDAHISAESRY
jgi:ribosome-associated protein